MNISKEARGSREERERGRGREGESERGKGRVGGREKGEIYTERARERDRS
jgi:hypothetical protein